MILVFSMGLGESVPMRQTFTHKKTELSVQPGMVHIFHTNKHGRCPWGYGIVLADRIEFRQVICGDCYSGTFTGKPGVEAVKFVRNLIATSQRIN